MTGAQIIETCHSIAKRQFPEETLEGLHARALCEITLLRTKVLELSSKLESVIRPAPVRLHGSAE